MAPKHCLPANLRIRFGESRCAQPYDSAPLNISAMSYGALSRNAIMARLLQKDCAPADWAEDWRLARADRWQ